MSRTVAFRCDASPSIGAGHVMRCLALAERMAGFGFEPVFLSAQGSAATVPALAASPFALVPVAPDDAGADAVAAAGRGHARAAIVDHYGLGAEAERALSLVADSVVAFEDIPGRAHASSILLDPTPGRTEIDYCQCAAPGTRVLAGGGYAILGDRWRAKRYQLVTVVGANARPLRVVVSMGMTDPANATARVLDALSDAGVDGAITVVLGGSAPHRNEIARRASSRVSLAVDPADLPGLVADADLVIGAPGSSSFERAMLGVPSILLPLADNQRDIAAAFARCGAAEVLEASLLRDGGRLAGAIVALARDPARRAAMAAAARELCDGRGADRLIAVLAGSTVAKDGTTVSLRMIEDADGDWLLALQSREETRKHSPGATPTPEGHARYMADVLANPDRLQMIVVTGAGQRVGFVRLDRRSAEKPAFVVSIAIDPDCHGRGYGSAALTLTRAMAPGAVLDAVVHADNLSSRNLFERAGYADARTILYRSLPQ